MRGIGNPHRAYSRSEWERARAGGIVDLDRAERTMEDGFRPPKVTEARVYTWLHGFDAAPRAFQPDDLGFAQQQAEGYGIRIDLEGDSNGWSARIQGHLCRTPAQAARTLGALAYSAAHDGVDVTHLCGDRE